MQEKESTQKWVKTMQICSNIDYLPYTFSKEFPFVDWGGNLYSPPTERGRLHSHNCLEIGYCFQGSGVFLVDDEILPFGAKDCSIIFPGQKHIASSNKADMSLWHFVMIDVGLLVNCFSQKETVGLAKMKNRRPNVPNLINAESYPHICMIIQMIVEQLAQKKVQYKNSVKALALSMLYGLSELDVLENKKLENRKYDAIAPALNYISNSYETQITLEKLAGMCNLSESTFRRNFKEMMGTSPLEFVHEIRIKVSTQLLREGRYSINQIAMMVGYDTLSSFNRQFRKSKGISPSRWKKLYSAP